MKSKCLDSSTADKKNIRGVLLVILKKIVTNLAAIGTFRCSSSRAGNEIALHFFLFSSALRSIHRICWHFHAPCEDEMFRVHFYLIFFWFGIWFLWYRNKYIICITVIASSTNSICWHCVCVCVHSANFVLYAIRIVHAASQIILIINGKITSSDTLPRFDKYHLQFLFFFSAIFLLSSTSRPIPGAVRRKSMPDTRSIVSFTVWLCLYTHVYFMYSFPSSGNFFPPSLQRMAIR